MITAQREPTLVIKNGQPRAIVLRDDRKITFYSLTEMGLEEIEKLLNKDTSTNEADTS